MYILKNTQKHMQRAKNTKVVEITDLSVGNVQGKLTIKTLSSTNKNNNNNNNNNNLSNNLNKYLKLNNMLCGPVCFQYSICQFYTSEHSWK